MESWDGRQKDSVGFLALLWDQGISLESMRRKVLPKMNDEPGSWCEGAADCPRLVVDISNGAEERRLETVLFFRIRNM